MVVILFSMSCLKEKTPGENETGRNETGGKRGRDGREKSDGETSVERWS